MIVTVFIGLLIKFWLLALILVGLPIVGMIMLGISDEVVRRREQWNRSEMGKRVQSRRALRRVFRQANREVNRLVRRRS